MNFVLEPIHLLVATIAGWVNRQQQEIIDYLMTQCQVLIETHGSKRILLTDDQRRRLAVKGKILGEAAGGSRPAVYPGHYPPLASHSGGPEVGL